MTCRVINGNVVHRKESESLDKVFFSEMAEEYFHHQEFSGMKLTHYDF